MCTSLAWNNGGFYFGRNLDLEVAFGQQVVITPRAFPLHFRREKPITQHYAMIGMATVMDGCPLYAEAANEKGLCIAGLNFPQYAHYAPVEECGKHAIAPFELPWWVLGQCASLAEAQQLLACTQVVDEPFSDRVPNSPLHWHVADREGSLVVECMADGMHLQENPVGVLTNSPPLDFHLLNLTQYMGLTAKQADNRLTDKVQLTPFGRGLGSFGLPGDASPGSRFVREAFLKLNSVCEKTVDASVAHFFHLLDAVSMPRGSVVAPGGRWEHTLYTCCIHGEEGVYYYKTYGNSQLTAVHLHHADLDGEALVRFPLEMRQQVRHAN